MIYDVRAGSSASTGKMVCELAQQLQQIDARLHQMQQMQPSTSQLLQPNTTQPTYTAGSFGL